MNQILLTAAVLSLVGSVCSHAQNAGEQQPPMLLEQKADITRLLVVYDDKCTDKQIKPPSPLTESKEMMVLNGMSLYDTTPEQWNATVTKYQSDRLANSEPRRRLQEEEESAKVDLRMIQGSVRDEIMAAFSITVKQQQAKHRSNRLLADEGVPPEMVKDFPKEIAGVACNVNGSEPESNVVESLLHPNVGVEVITTACDVPVWKQLKTLMSMPCVKSVETNYQFPRNSPMPMEKGLLKDGDCDEESCDDDDDDDDDDESDDDLKVDESKEGGGRFLAGRQLGDGPDDNKFKKQWYLRTDEKGSIDAQEGWDILASHHDVRNTVIALFDSGIYSHPDIYPDKLAYNEECAKGHEKIPRKCYGLDLIRKNKPRVVNPKENADQGTRMGSVMVARHDDKFIAGVCTKCTLMVIKVIKNDAIDSAALIEGYDFVIEHKIVMSVLGYARIGFVKAEYEAVSKLRDAHHLLVVAAGDDSCALDSTERCTHNGESFSLKHKPVTPAMFDQPNVMTVGGTGYRSYSKHDASNYGGKSVDLFAPSEKIFCDFGKKSVGYAPTSTAMSAAIVAGVAGMRYSETYWLVAEEVKSGVMISVDRHLELEDIAVVGGIVNLRNAMKRTLPAPTNPPH